MLVWSPNHCVSDAKREWVGPQVHVHPWELGAWVHASQRPALLRSGLESKVWAQAGGSIPLLGQAWVRSCNPSSKTWPLPPLQLTSTLQWPRRSMATTLSR